MKNKIQQNAEPNAVENTKKLKALENAAELNAAKPNAVENAKKLKALENAAELNAAKPNAVENAKKLKALENAAELKIAEKKSLKPKNVSFLKRVFLTLSATVLFRVLSAFMGAKTDGKKLAESVPEPCVILSTHGSIFDAAYAGNALIPKYYTGVVAKKLFSIPFLGKILKKAGFIPKKQFVVEISCIKQIKNSIDDNISVFICPEGKTSVDGRNSYLPPSVAKLIKWVGAPVLFYKPNGSYLSRPRFGKIRRGKIRVESRLLFSAEEIKELSTAAIAERLNEAFQYNDHEYQEKNRVKFRSGAPAKGLEKLLYKCPKCGAEFKNVSKKDVMSCLECGNAVKIDLYGKITPIENLALNRPKNRTEFKNTEFQNNAPLSDKNTFDNTAINSNKSVAFDRIDRWVDFQKDALTAEILSKRGGVNGGGFRLCEEVVLYSDDIETSKYIPTAKGVLTLSERGIEFSPFELFDADAKEGYFYPITALPTVAFGGKFLLLGQDNAAQYYAFTEVAKLYKWNFAVEILYGMNNPK